MPNDIDEIIRKLADGDMSALADLYSAVGARVYGYCLSMLKNRHDAEDALSDTILEAARYSKSYRPMGKPTAWVIRIARSVCVTKLRERKRLSDAPPEDFDVVDPSCKIEDAAALRACFNSLGDDEREIIVLHAAVGLKHREIAGLLGCPLSTALSRYQRAVKKLEKALYGKESGDL